MLVAITSSGNDLEAPLESRFGRAATLILINTDSEKFSVINNQQNMVAVQGAGIQTAQIVANAGAEALITGHTGPKAFKLLTQAAISVYHCEAATVREALKKYQNGELAVAAAADVEGHW